MVDEDKSPFLCGDFEEVYNEIKQEHGKIKALGWIWCHLMVSLPPLIKKNISWRINMFKNYLKIAFRNIFQYKGFSFLNIIGLSIGMAVCILILLFVRDELSYDSFHEHSKRIYRLEAHFLAPDGSVQGSLSSLAPSWVPHLENEFPEMEHVARIFAPGNTRISRGDRHFLEEKLFFAEADIFEILSIPLIKGDAQQVLKNPGSIVISETTAVKYFGNQNPMGQQMKIDDRILCQVTAIMKDFQKNSHMHPDFLVSYTSLKGLSGSGETDYFLGSRNFTDNVTQVYMRLARDVSIESIRSRLPAFIDKTLGIRTDATGRTIRYSESARIFPRRVLDIHLHSHTLNEFEPNSDMRYVTLFTIIAFFILIIACINFMNLSTARATKRAREIGIRKVMGATRQSLTSQFLSESLLMSFMAMILALGLSALLLPAFNAFSGHDLYFYSIINPTGLLILLGALVVSGLVAGLYPAIYLSSFRPTTILRGELTRGMGGALLRKILVVFQFAISATLIISVGVVFKQMSFLNNADLGFDRENIILVSADREIKDNWQEVKNSLLENPNILAVTASKRAPSGRLGDIPGFSIEINGEVVRSPIQMPHNRVEHDFFKTYGMKIIAGRDFSIKHTTDASEAYIINETAAQRLGWEDPDKALGTPITPVGAPKGKIIGVVKDFNYESLHNRIVPIVTYIAPRQMNTVSVKVTGNNIQQTLAHIQKTWNRFNPGFAIKHSFLNDRLSALYYNERRMMEMFSYFSILAIFVACLGLFGLASFSTEQRTKEIGVRKVLGASLSNIVILLSRDFTRWVLLANVISWPLAYWAMKQWLGNFAYQVNVGWIVFVMATIMTLVIAIFTISYQSIKSALSNPLDALKYE